MTNTDPAYDNGTDPSAAHGNDAAARGTGFGLAPDAGVGQNPAVLNGPAPTAGRPARTARSHVRHEGRIVTASPQDMAPATDAGPYLIRNLDWDDLPRMTAIGKDGPDPFTYDDLVKVIESQYTLGVVCATPSGPAGYMVYVASDGTGRAARKSGRLHIGVGIVRVQVAPEWRRKGVGRFLINTVERALVKQFGDRAAAGKLRMHATVNETWLPGLLFLKGIGFRTPDNKDHAIQRGKLDGGRHDGYLMERFAHWPNKPVAPAQTAPAQKAA